MPVRVIAALWCASPASRGCAPMLTAVRMPPPKLPPTLHAYCMLNASLIACCLPPSLHAECLPHCMLKCLPPGMLMASLIACCVPPSLHAAGLPYGSGDCARQARARKQGHSDGDRRGGRHRSVALAAQRHRHGRTGLRGRGAGGDCGRQYGDAGGDRQGGLFRAAPRAALVTERCSTVEEHGGACTAHSPQSRQPRCRREDGRHQADRAAARVELDGGDELRSLRAHGDLERQSAQPEDRR